jgi:imidazoleglycerol-phosphate dehydratase
MKRRAQVTRKTKETDIRVVLGLDGSGKSRIATGVPFLDHMLELFAKHSLFDLEIACKGDTHIDDHHSVEDTAICLGRAFREAIGDKAGMTRFGAALVPMDETLARAVVDLSGRAYLVYHVKTTRAKIGTFATELAEHFWHSFAEHCKCNLHIEVFYGRNQHHIIEAVFKATARALAEATAVDRRIKGVLSTKGTLV